MHRHVLLVWIGIASIGCSSSDFELAQAPVDESDTGVDPVDTALPAVDAEPVDSTEPPVDSDGSLDAAVEDAGSPDAPCDPLPSNPTTVFVDARSTRELVGTAGCPLKSIRAALSLLAALPSTTKRTVKLAGGTAGAPVVYNEVGTIVLKSKVSLVGVGSTGIVIKGGGPCGAAQCVMVLEGDAALAGVTIDVGNRIGLMVNPASALTVSVKDVVITNTLGATTPAVQVDGPGSVDFGPAFRVVKNEGPGLVVQSVATVRVLPGGTVPNAFDDNATGVLVHSGTLDFGGGEILRNGWAGLILAATPGKHTVQNLVAKDNIGPGLAVELGVALKLRGSTLVRNRVGLLIRFGTAVDVDLGSTADPGKNFFGGAAGEKNTRAAVCLPVARSTKLPASGNVWPACAPRANLVGGVTCDTLTYYTDVFYTPLTTGDPGAPLDYGACDVGP